MIYRLVFVCVFVLHVTCPFGHKVLDIRFEAVGARGKIRGSPNLLKINPELNNNVYTKLQITAVHS